MTWSVDAAFAVHEDMRSHTGACLTMGKGAMLSLSTKQKINTRSSTEAELVGVDDAMNFVVWSKLFFDWQFKDYNPSESTSEIGKTNVLLQDNTMPSNWSATGSNLVRRGQDISRYDISM